MLTALVCADCSTLLLELPVAMKRHVKVSCCCCCSPDMQQPDTLQHPHSSGALLKVLRKAHVGNGSMWGMGNVESGVKGSESHVRILCHCAELRHIGIPESPSL